MKERTIVLCPLCEMPEYSDKLRRSLTGTKKVCRNCYGLTHQMLTGQSRPPDDDPRPTMDDYRNQQGQRRRW